MYLNWILTVHHCNNNNEMLRCSHLERGVNVMKTIEGDILVRKLPWQQQGDCVNHVQGLFHISALPSWRRHIGGWHDHDHDGPDSITVILAKSKTTILDKSARLIIRLLFGFASDSVFNLLNQSSNSETFYLGWVSWWPNVSFVFLVKNISILFSFVVFVDGCGFTERQMAVKRSETWYIMLLTTLLTKIPNRPEIYQIKW